MNLFVHPLNGLIKFCVVTELSIERTEVVPIAQMFLLFSIPLLIIFTLSSGIITCSESILCLLKSSTSTARNVPRPTCKVSSAKLTPTISNRFINSRLKCSPAVGAATAPSCFA